MLAVAPVEIRRRPAAAARRLQHQIERHGFPPNSGPPKPQNPPEKKLQQEGEDPQEDGTTRVCDRTSGTRIRIRAIDVDLLRLSFVVRFQLSVDGRSLRVVKRSSTRMRA